jgi:hypothetical protein
MALALQQAAARGIGWLLHADPDELVHVGHPSGSLAAVLAALPCNVPAVRILNYEAQPEAGDVVNRYEQVGRRARRAGPGGQARARSASSWHWPARCRLRGAAAPAPRPSPTSTPTPNPPPSR